MKRKSLFPCLTLLLAASLILAVLIGWTVTSLPKQAENRFGTASPQLSRVDRLYFSALLLTQEDELRSPGNPAGSPLDFEVSLGEPTDAIINRLFENDLIRDPGSLRAYLLYTGLDTSLQAGRYQLSPAMSPIEIARQMQDSTPSEVTLLIFPGWRLEEVAAALPTTGLEITPDAFLQAAHLFPPAHPLAKQTPAGVSLEGFLLPGQYILPRQTGAAELAAILLDQFNRQVDSSLRAGFESRSLTLYEAVTLASIVEREAVLNAEKPLIASVFLNRLAASMKLDADPTVQYALGYQSGRGGWWASPLTREDLRTDSPYNTYIYAGLPPGPIGNPSLEALQAVAFPQESPYFYFRAACDGSGAHLFAETYAEHLNNGCP